MWLKSLTIVFVVSVSVLGIAQAEESWAWDVDTTSAASGAVATEEQVQGRGGSVLAEDQVQDANGRFFGLDKLCKLGIGINCHNKRPYQQNVNSHYQVKPHPIHPYHLPTKYPNTGPVYTSPSPYDTFKTEYVVPQQVHSHIHIHQTGHAPVAQTAAPIYPKVFREQCECVVPQYCETQDVIARRDFNDISHFLDPRSELKDGFESNATSTYTSIRGRSNTKDDAPESIATTGEVERTKRETSTQGGQIHKYSIEGRQFTSYTPGYNGCSHGQICCRRPVFIPPRPKPTFTRPTHNPSRYTCGRSQSSGILGRIKTPHYLQGDAEFAEYPWQAAILKDASHDPVYACGAALIDEQHVLTAAHCVDGLNQYNLRVRLGDWDLTQSSEFFHHLELQVANVIKHQDFYKGNLKNDIAILRLASRVDFNANPHISPVCLPDQYSDTRGQQCVVTGWGKDSFNYGKFQIILKEVTVPVVDHYACQNAMRQTRLGRSFNLDPGMLCAGGEEAKDACQGDGGSPLVCRKGDGSYQLTGLVSWGIGCGQRGIPGVYVNVKNYLQWIKIHTQYNNHYTHG